MPCRSTGGNDDQSGFDADRTYICPPASGPFPPTVHTRDATTGKPPHGAQVIKVNGLIGWRSGGASDFGVDAEFGQLNIGIRICGPAGAVADQILASVTPRG